MKRLPKVHVLLATGFCIAAIWSLGFSPFVLANEPAEGIATLVGVSGEVNVNSQPVRSGQQLQPGDLIEAAPGASATIVFDRGTASIYGGSEGATLKLPRPGPSVFTQTWRLFQGLLGLDVNPDPRGKTHLEVEAENVIVGVEGTILSVASDPDTHQDTISVEEGTVSVAPKNPALPAFALSAGTQVQVDSDSIGPIIPIGPGPGQNRPPRAPTLLGPADLSSQLDPNFIRFQWQNNGDPDGDALGFYINVFEYDAFSGEWSLVFESSVKGTSVALEEFEPNTFYAWRVFAVDWARRSDPWYAASDIFGFDTLEGFGAVANPPTSPPEEDQSAPPIGPVPPPSASLEEVLDANANGVLDDAEIRQAVQYWILGQTVPGTDQTIDDATIRRLIQMWILGEPVSATDAAGAQGRTPQGLRVEAIQLSEPSALGRELRLLGRDIDALKVQVFDLSGRLQLEAQSSGPQLRFFLVNAQGQPLANGVYLYVVSVQGLDGQGWQGAVRKLVVMR